MFQQQEKIAAFVLAAALSAPPLALEYRSARRSTRRAWKSPPSTCNPWKWKPDGHMEKSRRIRHPPGGRHPRAGQQPQRLRGRRLGAHLVVKFEVAKVGGDFKIAGEFMPMVANDGPTTATTSNSPAPANTR